MAISSLSLPLPGLKTALAEALYNEILSNTNNYYYFIGKALEWTGGVDAIEAPSNSPVSEADARNEMIFFKKVTAADVAYTIPRYNWVSGEVYDKYDNSLGDTVTYTAPASANALHLTGTFDLSKFGVGWKVTGDGIAEDTYVDEATTTRVTLTKFTSGMVTNVTFTKVGQKYNTQLSVGYVVSATSNTFTLNGTFDISKFQPGWRVTGSGIPNNTFITAMSSTTVTLSKQTTGSVTNVTFTQTAEPTSLETSRFYVLTADNAVYKCLNNNQGAASTVKPYSTTHEPITTSDGYVWKYMYTIPSSLVNKFMTLYDMPVTTSVKAPYYSNGTIGALRVLNYGANYAATDTIAVTGDGNRTGNRFQLASVSINNPGSGYDEAPTVTFSDPFDNVVNWAVSTNVLAGQYLKVTSSGKIYLVITGGKTGTVAPTHTSNISQVNGTTALRFVGLTAQGTAVMDGDVVDSITMSGIIGFVDVRNIGAGYDPDPLNRPQVTINGNGTGAQAYAQVSATGYITDIVLTDRGSGYSGSVTVSIDPPDVTVDAEYQASLSVTAGDIIQYGNNLYIVAQGITSLGNTAPTHTHGTVDGLIYRSKAPIEATATAQVYYGYGYNSIPSVTLSAPVSGVTAEASVNALKTEAVLRPIVENGQIVGITIVDGGEGYTTATISATSNTGTGAVIEADLSLGDLNTRQANSELLAVPGTIDSIDVLHPGIGYTVATVTITGDGSGATAEAVITDGAITKINVTNTGVNYTHAVVTITGSSDQQAYARAVVSPIAGHGKNAIKELYAKDLALATTISQDRNQGFVVDNEYRQLGLIKNPTDPSTGYRSTRITGSSCYVVAGNFNYNLVPEDTELVDDATHVYHVVARPANAPVSGPVSLLISSPDNITPTVGEVVSYANTTAVISSVTQPTIDKYSGELLFLDNRASFKPTDEQTVSIKTVIRL